MTAVDADLPGEERNPGAIFTQPGNQVDVDEGHLAAGLHGPDQRTEMKCGSANEKDGRYVGGERSRKVFGVADDGCHGHAIEGLEEARDRSIDRLCAGGRRHRASGHRHLLLRVSILRGAAISRRPFHAGGGYFS
jgi:hypothetical protein